MMKILIHSVNNCDVDRDLSSDELSYLINVVLDSLVLKSKADTRANIDDRLYQDRMESAYDDNTIQLVLDIITSMIYKDDIDVIDIEKVDYKVTVNYLNKVVIILQLISKNKWINRLRKDRV